MTVEQLIYNIPIKLHSSFIELDELIWTPYLTQFNFFVSKEVWTKSDNPNYLAIIIYWKTLEEWKSLPVSELNAINKKFEELSLNEFGQIFLIKESLTYNRIH